ncbi:MAG: YkgJ family cysteine cluster protein, partial [Thermoplasmata archaeon]
KSIDPKPVFDETGVPLQIDGFNVIERLDEDLITEKEWLPVTPELHWKCLKCGWCCTQNWRLNLTWKEYERIKNKLTIDQVVVDEETGMSHPVYTINKKCERYDPKTHKCTIYKHRLYTCAAFPFILDEHGNLLRSKFCKGFGSGNPVDIGKMKTYLRKWRKRAGMRKI